MDWLNFVEHFQLAAISAGVFMSLWGLKTFRYCLWQVLRGMNDQDTHFTDKCTWHACWGMLCISCLLFCVSRAITIGAIPGDQIAAGIFFIAGMTGFMSAIGMSIWAAGLDERHQEVSQIKLSQMFWVVVVIIAAFAGAASLQHGM